MLGLLGFRGLGFGVLYLLVSTMERCFRKKGGILKQITLPD